MKIQDSIWLTYRHLKTSLVGSILVILAIAIGVGMAATTTAFIGKYNEQTRDLLNHPAYREILVEALGDPKLETELPLPVVELEGKELRTTQFNIKDLPLVLKSIPNLIYAYLADADIFKSTSFILEDYAKGLVEKADYIEKQKTREHALEDKSKEKAVEKDKREIIEEKEKTVNWLEELDKQGIAELPIQYFSGVYTTPDFFTAYGLNTVSGSVFTEEDLGMGNPVIVLGSELSATIFPDGNALGAKLAVNYQTYTVLGVLEYTNLVLPDTTTAVNNLAFVPHYVYQGMAYGKKGKGQVGTIRFAVTDSDKIQQAVIQLQEYIALEYPEANVRVSAAIDKLKTDRDKSVRILMVLVFLSLAGLFIAAINMFNLLLIRVIKQTKGIGIARALGFSRNNVFKQFLFESIFMSLIGTVVGLIASPFIYQFLKTALLSNLDKGQGTIFWDLLLGTVIALSVSIVFGAYPALLARQTDAATAIRAE